MRGIKQNIVFECVASDAYKNGVHATSDNTGHYCEFDAHRMDTDTVEVHLRASDPQKTFTYDTRASVKLSQGYRVVNFLPELHFTELKRSHKLEILQASPTLAVTSSRPDLVVVDLERADAVVYADVAVSSRLSSPFSDVIITFSDPAEPSHTETMRVSFGSLNRDTRPRYSNDYETVGQPPSWAGSRVFCLCLALVIFVFGWWLWPRIQHKF
eukprot:TRINITY_DN1584_c0_g2_i1.p1 TRINITY_DN1584_c0_g2~~TRINITY_DN1584_c0_g2_i1.p1  ORF type:complete len:213 (+),score=27.70 TRINITY_DN1584_c0_g2_i1:203-841(+)